MPTSLTTPQPRVSRTRKHTKNSTAPVRKKACKACSLAKVRCDLVRPSCSRCNIRKLQCRYVQPTTNYQVGTYWPASSITPPDHPVAPEPPGYESTTSTGAFGEASQLVDSRKAPSPLPIPRSAAQSFPSVTEAAAYHPGGNTIDFLQPPEITGPDPGEDVLPSTAGAPPFRSPPAPQHPATNGPLDPIREPKSVPGIDLAAPILVCAVDSVRVRDRWFREFEPPTDGQPKEYTPGMLHFMSRVMESFPRKMATGDIHALPPIIHPAQMRTSPVPTALVNCITLTRMWESRVPGSEAFVRATITREMERLLQERRSYDQLNLLAAFQAYFLYTILLVFPVHQPCPKSTHDSPEGEASQLASRMIMINLQEIAHDLTLTGMICLEELQGQAPTMNSAGSVPDLSSWILAATKCRTLVAMYILDSTYYCNTTNRLWSNADEIGNLPAPGGKTLWNASIQCSVGDLDIADADAKWRREYKRYLGQWEEPDGRTLLVRIEEFWPGKGKPGRDRELARETRVGKWLRDVDEFGMMFFAVTGVTHFS